MGKQAMGNIAYNQVSLFLPSPALIQSLFLLQLSTCFKIWVHDDTVAKDGYAALPPSVPSTTTAFYQEH